MGRAAGGASACSFSVKGYQPGDRESLRSTVVFTAAIDGDKQIRERVKWAIALYYRETGGQAVALLAPDIRYRPRKDDELPIRVRVHCAAEILGLPWELVA